MNNSNRANNAVLRLVSDEDGDDDSRAIGCMPNAFQIGTALFGPDRKLTHINDCFKDILPRVTNFTDMPMQSFFDHILENVAAISSDEAAIWCEKQLSRTTPPSTEPVFLQTELDQQFCFQTSPVLSGGVSVTAYEVSVLLQRELAQQKALDKATNALSAQSDSLAMMTHELRRPMNGIIGMASLLAESKLDDEQRLFVGTILSSGNALLQLVNQILDTSKNRSQQLEVKHEGFDLERCIHEVFLLLQTKAAEKALELVVDYDLFLPTAFVGDVGRIRQILINLVGNAIKFTEQGHILVRVVGIPDPTNTQSIHITVEDTGMGIPSDQIDGVFSKYQQVISEQTEGIEGTGLGLAITKELVELLGGEMWVDSELGQGSSFGFSIDLQANESVPAPNLTKTENLKVAAIVSDVAINRQVFAKQLDSLGISSVVFSSACDAKAYFATNTPPDFLLVDHRPLALNGQGLAMALRQAGLSQPIILTASRLNLPELRANRPVNSLLLAAPIRRADIVHALSVVGGDHLSETEPQSPFEHDDPKGKLRVMVAEDNATNQLVFRKMIKGLDIDLYIVGDGRKAVQAFADFRPEFIFMDISMPNMDGHEATRIIRATEDAEGLPHTEIVALTAFAEIDEDGLFSESGFDRYMYKPLKKEQLCKAINNMIQKHGRSAD